MHTFFSDGKDHHEAYIEQAIKLGFDEIGFSDHICLTPVDWRTKPTDIHNMVEKVIRLKEETKDLRIRLGVEVDYIEGMEKETEKLIKSLPLDYVIGAVHFVGGWYYNTDTSAYSPEELSKAFSLYFNAIQKSAKSGLFDIIAHPDLIKKQGFVPKESLVSLYHETAKVFHDSNVAIEINTNGINKPCADNYPSSDFLLECFNQNVPVTLSSDAHKAKLLGQYFSQGYDLLKITGYNETAHFAGRKRTLCPISK